MTAWRKGLTTTGAPPQTPSDDPRLQPGHEAGPSWHPNPAGAGNPGRYTESIGSRLQISVTLPQTRSGNNTPTVPNAPQIIQSVSARNGGDMAPRDPANQRSPDGLLPIGPPTQFGSGIAALRGGSG